MGAKGSVYGSAAKAASKGAPTSSNRAIAMMGGLKPQSKPPTKKQLRKKAHSQQHQNVASPTEEAGPSNFEEEIKKRRASQGDRGTGSGYGGNTQLG